MNSKKNPLKAVRLQGVRKAFDGHVAVDGLSLTVPAGSIYGFIGPNGSGKTTTLRMIMNLILPDQGSIEVLGLAGAAAARDRVSYLPEERGLYKKMRVGDLLHYFALLKGVPSAGLDASVGGWLKRLDLFAWSDKKVETLSKGMAQKVQFIAAVISEPDLLILDEPFSGLDPGGVQQMKAIIRQIRAEGRTVIFSTHQMAAAEELCDYVGMIFKGRQVLDGTLRQIRRAHGQGGIRVRSDKSLGFLRKLRGVLSAREDERSQVLQVAGPPQRFLGQLLRCAKVRHFELYEPSLNDVFLELIRAPA